MQTVRTLAIRLLTLALIVLAGVGCGAPDVSAPDAGATARQVPEPTITLDGATTTVTNTAEAFWSGDGELIEEASIGAARGGEQYLLGGVTSIAAGGDRIYLVDFQAVKVRVYGWDGTHVLDIGSLGAGPGEFQRPFDIGLSEAGRIIVRDQAQRRVHIFSPDGELVEDWPTERGNRATIATDGSVYVIQENIFPDAAGEVTVRVRRYDPAGEAGDWQAFPNRPPPPLIETTGNQLELMAIFLGIGADWRSTMWVPFGPRVVAEVAPNGAMVSGRADAYSFDVHRDDGSVMVVEKEWEPVPVGGDEADWTKRRLTAQWRAATNPSWMWLGGEIPPHKGAFKYIVPTVDGRFWVVRQMAGVARDGCNTEPADYYAYDENPCWRQPLVADVFDEEGRFLGPVPMPDGIRYHVRPYIRDDTVIALLEDAEGTRFVKRYRLRVPD